MHVGSKVASELERFIQLWVGRLLVGTRLGKTVGPILHWCILPHVGLLLNERGRWFLNGGEPLFFHSRMDLRQKANLIRECIVYLVIQPCLDYSG